jgi:transcriptional regulator with PAS, ATPase and Fis domain
MLNTKDQEKREKEDLQMMLNSKVKKSEICKALGIRADVLNEKIRKYKLRG